MRGIVNIPMKQRKKESEREGGGDVLHKEEKEVFRQKRKKRERGES